MNRKATMNKLCDIDIRLQGNKLIIECSEPLILMNIYTDLVDMVKKCK